MECKAIMVHVLYVALLECLKKRSSDALEIRIVMFWVVTPCSLGGGGTNVSDALRL
jgi:hypothetical protein